MPDNVPNSLPPAEELALLREQVLDLGEALTALTVRMNAMSDGICTVLGATGRPAPAAMTRAARHLRLVTS